MSEVNTWIKKGMFWQYKKSPSREEKFQETIRSNAELRNNWVTKYPELKQCPECESKNYTSTLLGSFITKEHYHDPNRKTCWDCGHKWRVTCPSCGHTDK